MKIPVDSGKRLRALKHAADSMQLKYVVYRQLLSRNRIFVVEFKDEQECLTFGNACGVFHATIDIEGRKKMVAVIGQNNFERSKRRWRLSVLICIAVLILLNIFWLYWYRHVPVVMVLASMANTFNLLLFFKIAQKETL